MTTVIISQTNNSLFHIESFWNNEKDTPNFFLKETGEVFRTQRAACKRCHKLLKKDREKYYLTHEKKIVRVRTKPVRTEVMFEKNVWTQLNIG
jgi:hypothetical protein